jgi:hypothetical protein
LFKPFDRSKDQRKRESFKRSTSPIPPARVRGPFKVFHAGAEWSSIISQFPVP